MAESEKLRSLQIAIEQIEKSHGKGSIMKLGDGVIAKIDCITTGSISLDAAQQRIFFFTTVLGLPALVIVLGAFVLPVVLVLSLKTIVRSASFAQIGPTLGGAWIWVHIALATIGIAAFVLNFAGAVMYLLQERQLKNKRPGTFYYRLPDLETLDHLTYRTLALGFPFLTVGLILGALWAGTAWGSLFAFDPLALFSFVAWAIYAATLAGRAAAGWHGRRAAYFAVAGFAALVVTLGAGLYLPGRHGS